jgi:hypothetical protein
LTRFSTEINHLAKGLKDKISYYIRATEMEAKDETPTGLFRENVYQFIRGSILHEFICVLLMKGNLFIEREDEATNYAFLIFCGGNFHVACLVQNGRTAIANNVLAPL